VSQSSTASMAGSSQAGGLGDQGDEARSVRYRLDCRRSCSQGQRPFRVGDRPFADTSGRASSRRSLAGQEQSLSGWATANPPKADLDGSEDRQPFAPKSVRETGERTCAWYLTGDSRSAHLTR
jgi:hypothetical protein